jgi:hypothetical protein
VEKGHGRVTQRKIRAVEVTPESAGFPGAELLVELCSQTGDADWESRWFATSRGDLLHDKRTLATHIRQHWSVENKTHHPKDGTLREDGIRCRIPRLLTHMILLRNLVLFYHKRRSASKTWLPEWIEKNQAGTRRCFDMVVHNRAVK